MTNFKPQEYINNVAGVVKDEWAANLKSLALKHPEMFRSEADVFRVIKEIKDGGTHFLENLNDDVALIAKRLSGGKVGNVGVVKQSGKIIHANKTNERYLKRLIDRQTKRRREKGKPVAPPAATTAQKMADGELLLKASPVINIPKKDKNKLKIEFSNLEKQLIEAAPTAKEILEKAKVKEAKIDYALKRIKEILEAK